MVEEVTRVFSVHDELGRRLDIHVESSGVTIFVSKASEDGARTIFMIDDLYEADTLFTHAKQAIKEQFSLNEY